MDCNIPGSSVHGDSPGKNTGGGCYALLQGIFPIQGSNPGLPHCRWILYCLIHQGSPTEALHRAKFKFLGCQETCISKKWGFTQFNADEFENMVAEKWLVLDDCGVKYIPNRGPLDKQRACTHESLDTIPSLLMPTNKSYFPVQKKECAEKMNVTWWQRWDGKDDNGKEGMTQVSTFSNGAAGSARPWSREAGWGWAGVGEKTMSSDLDMLNLWLRTWSKRWVGETDLW